MFRDGQSHVLNRASIQCLIQWGGNAGQQRVEAGRTCGPVLVVTQHFVRVSRALSLALSLTFTHTFTHAHIHTIFSLQMVTGIQGATAEETE